MCESFSHLLKCLFYCYSEWHLTGAIGRGSLITQFKQDEVLQMLFFYLAIIVGHVTIYLTARNLLQASLHIESELHKSNQPIKTPQPSDSCIAPKACTTFVCTFMSETTTKQFFSSDGKLLRVAFLVVAIQLWWFGSCVCVCVCGLARAPLSFCKSGTSLACCHGLMTKLSEL